MTKKISLMLIFTFLLTQTCLSQTNEFYERVLGHEICRNCYFIALNVNSKVYSGRVVIETDDLFLLLKSTKGFNKAQYKNFMKDLLEKKETLILSEARYDKYGLFVGVRGVGKIRLRTVKEISRIEEAASKGCVAFVKHYFLIESLEPNENSSADCKHFIKNQKGIFLLRQDLSENEKSAIINKLFEWHIAVYYDGLAGSLAINP